MLSESFCRRIKNCDTLSRFDGRRFALLIPQTAADEARRICNRLRGLFEKEHLEKNGIHLVIWFGLSELRPAQDETGWALLARATESLKAAKLSGPDKSNLQSS